VPASVLQSLQDAESSWRVPITEKHWRRTFGQIRIHFQRATAVKLRILQLEAGWIELEVTSGTHKRKSGMSEGESGISSDRVDQLLGRVVQQRRIAGRAKPVAAHEFCISLRVLAVPGATLDLR
jgi:hypothetical protein